MPESETPKYTADGQLIPFGPEVFREWIWVGEPLTPNDLNDGEANFSEFHDVYINPTAWREWKKSGTFPEGTVLIKELTSVGSKKAPSGNADVDPHLERRGGDHAVEVPREKLPLDPPPLFGEEAGAVARDARGERRLLAPQPGVEQLGDPPRLGEHDRFESRLDEADEELGSGALARIAWRS